MRKKNVPPENEWEMFARNGCVVVIIPKESEGRILYEASLRTESLDIFEVASGFDSLYEAMVHVEAWGKAVQTFETRYVVRKEADQDGFILEDKKTSKIVTKEMTEVDIRKKWFSCVWRPTN